MPAEDRKSKLAKFVYTIAQLDEFSTERAKEACRDFNPAYVTRHLKQLTRDGLLTTELRNDNHVFRWEREVASDSGKHELDHWIGKQIHGEQVKQLPLEDRPREHLLADGVTSLSNSELIAILIRVGVVGESAIQGGRNLMRFFEERLASLPDASLQELRAISKTIRKDSYCQVMAGIELGRRIALLREMNLEVATRIRGSAEAIDYCMKTFRRLAVDGKQEEFHIVTLDTQLGPIGKHLITKGTLDASLVHPREVYRAAIRDAASAILLVHNHPSGDPSPSREDFAVTKRLEEAGELIGIRVVDHIVVARESGRSIMEER